MKKQLLLLLLLLAFGKVTGQTKAHKALPGPSQITLAAQTWATSNLSTDHFRNGDPIAEAKTEAEWAAANAAHRPAWCYYRNEASRGGTYGKLYNWYAVSDA